MTRSMMKFVVFLALPCAGIAGSAAVVEIDGKAYSLDEIVARMGGRGVDPMVGVEKITREIVIKQLAQERALIEPTEAAIYKDLTGGNLAIDKAPVDGIPGIARPETGGRLAFYEEWLSHQAESRISIRITDENKFWELLTETEPFRAREANGQAPRKENWPYLWGELVVDPAMVVVQKGNGVFVTGSEFNDYIRSNTANVQRNAKRSQPLAEARKEIARTVVRGKLNSQAVAGKSLKVPDAVKSHMRADYLKQNRLTATLMVKGDKGRRKNDLDLEAVEALRLANDGRLKRLDAVLGGSEVLGSNDGDIVKYAFAAANGAARKELSNGITEDDTYKWMMKTHFPGSIREAKEVMVTERLNARLAETMAKDKITIASFE